MSMYRIQLKNNRGRPAAFAIGIVLAALILGVGAAYAETNRVTKGDVQSVFQAFTTGGRVVRLQASETAGFHAAPAQRFNGSIRPFPLSPWDGSRQCVDDWHVILIGLFEGGDQSYKLQDASDYFSQVGLSFTLDGDPLSTERTSVKRFLEPENFGLEVAYGFQEGKIMSPDELEVGEYTLTLSIEDPVYGDEELTITFFIDDSDSTTCTG